jgi:GT2 family glycosyltransferase
MTIGLFGTFEIDNYGDLLFPAILERVLSRDIPGLEIRLFSPCSGVYKFNGAEIQAVTDLESVADTLDGFVLGGGDIIRFDIPPAYDPREMQFPPYAQLAILPALLAGLTGKPLVWNAPGIPHALTPAQRMILEGIQSSSAYVAVRDDQSKDQLRIEDRPVAVVPDTGFLLAEVFPKQQLTSLQEKLKERYGLPAAYGVLHVSPATSDADQLKSAAAISALADNLPLILLPLGPVHGEIEILTRLQEFFPDPYPPLCLPPTLGGDTEGGPRQNPAGNCRVISDRLHPLEMAALIAHSRWFVGTSLHGNITAFAYGIPGLAVNTKGLAKLAQFGKLTGRRVLKSWDEVGPAFQELMQSGQQVSQEEANRRKEIKGNLLVHFRRIKDALGEPETLASGAVRAVALPTLQLIRGLISAEREKQPALREDPSYVALSKTVAEHNRFIAVQEQIIDEKNRVIDERQAKVEDLSLIIQTEKNSTAGRAIELFRSLREFLCPANTWRRWALGGFRKAARLVLSDAIAGRFQKEIGKWLKKRQGLVWDARRRAKITRELAQLGYQPLISIITPVYNVDELWLRSAIESVRAQIYPHWELCLVNDGSTAEWIKPILDKFAASDLRIRVKHLETNEGIAGASNHALALATGEFAGLLDHDDELTPDALFEVVKRLNDDPALDLLYSDEDKIGVEGVETDPFFKPGWNPDLLLSCNYITHFSLFRGSLLQKIGGFQQGFEGSQDYDLLLRFTEETNRIAHIPKILYHWRAIRGSAAASPTAKPSAYTAARRAIGQAVRRRGHEAKVESISPGIYRVCYAVRDNPRVSILIPAVSEPPGNLGRESRIEDRGSTMNRLTPSILDSQSSILDPQACRRHETDLHRCITSLTQINNYPNYEIIILTQGASGEPGTSVARIENRRSKIDKEQTDPIDPRSSILDPRSSSLPNLPAGSCVAYRFASDLSISEVMNLGARRAQGDYLVFLNPELEIIRPDWLAALLEQAQRKEVGAVGAKLLGADGQLAHSGMVVGPHGLVSRWHKNLAADSIHRVVYTEVVRDCSAVSADCLMVAKRKFEEVNGFDVRFRRHYHDVDLCLRLGQKGYSTVYTPHATLQFISFKSSKQTRLIEDETLFRRIWRNHVQDRDPYFHPNLSKRLRLAG